MKHLLLLSTTLLLFAFSVPPAEAHRLRVFAYESGGEILVEARFGSGRPAQHIAIRVEDGAGKVLRTATTDEQGTSRLPLPAIAKERAIDLTIIADAGEGHRGSWLLAAEEYLQAGAADAGSADIPADEKTSPPDTGDESLTPMAEADRTTGLDYTVIEKIVRKSVAAEIAPLKHRLAADRQRTITLQDIIGGIGYILGIAGIAAYFQAKRKGEQR